jgi:hypothetical protein
MVGLELTGGHHPQAPARLARSRAAGNAQHRLSSDPVTVGPSGLGTPSAGPSQVSPSAGRQVGNSMVSVAGNVASDPNTPEVVSLLTSYFTAINDHDYQAYVSLYGQRFRQSYSAQQFSAAYSSTTDSAITLTGLIIAGDGKLVAAMVTFVSHQDPAQSPDDAACENWTITIYYEQQGGTYFIGASPAGYQPEHSPC